MRELFRFIAMFMRSLIGITIFNLPMRCIPHRRSAASLLSVMAAILTLAHIVKGELAVAVFFSIIFLIFLPRKNKKLSEDKIAAEMAKTYVIIPLVYVIMLSDVIVFGMSFVLNIYQGLSHADEERIYTFALNVWQSTAIFVYSKKCAEYHKALKSGY